MRVPMPSPSQFRTYPPLPLSLRERVGVRATRPCTPQYHSLLKQPSPCLSPRERVLSRHRPAPRIGPGQIVAVRLRRVAVDQRARVERVADAADLVLDGEEHLAGLGVGYILEAVLVLIALLADQALLQQA